MMDSSLYARDVAVRLGVSVATVLRWCRKGTVPADKGADGRWTIPAAELAGLAQRHGSVPAPLPQGLDRQDALVLAALVRAPRGLVSARAVAAVTGLSPTTASGRLKRHLDAGYAVLRTEPRSIRGRARNTEVWYANLDDVRLVGLLGYLHRITLPAFDPGPVPSALPDHLWHLFWNADPAAIDPRHDGAAIAHRAITAQDVEAIAWVVTTLPTEAISAALGYRGADSGSAVWARASRFLRGVDDAAA